MRRFGLSLVSLLAAFAVLSSGAHACSLDGKPSAYADGVRAVLTRGMPTAATYSWWAHFTFARTLQAGRPIRFREDDAQVRPLLLPEALRHSWRWYFGDGGALTSDQATHTYRRPGRYKVQVTAYFPHYGWQAFDQITLTVRP